MNKWINESIIVFCPRACHLLQTQHSPLYSILSLPFRTFIQPIYHNVVYHPKSSSALNFLPIYHSFSSILQHAVAFKPVTQSIYFPLLYQFQHYSSFSHSFQHNCFFYFVCPFYTLHPSPYPHLKCLQFFSHSVIVSRSLHHTTLHST